MVATLVLVGCEVFKCLFAFSHTSILWSGQHAIFWHIARQRFEIVWQILESRLADFGRN